MKTKEIQESIQSLQGQITRLRKEHEELLRRVDHNKLLHPPEFDEGATVWFGNQKAVMLECSRSVALIELLVWNPNSRYSIQDKGDWEHARESQKMAVEIKMLSREKCANPK